MADEMLKNAQPQELESQIGEEDGLKEQLLRMCRQNKLAAFSAVLILVVILIAIFAPVLAPYGEAEQDLISRLQGPSAAHWFGTDELGRDVFSRILYGSRLSLTIGILPSIISLVVGIFFGLLAGYFGGWVDYIIMRLADIMLSIPSLLLAMVVMYAAAAIPVCLQNQGIPAYAGWYLPFHDSARHCPGLEQRRQHCPYDALQPAGSDAGGLY